MKKPAEFIAAFKKRVHFASGEQTDPRRNFDVRLELFQGAASDAEKA